MTLEYKCIKIDDDFEECASCGAEAPLYEFKRSRDRGWETEPVLYCELCAASGISTAYEYPDQFQDQRLMASIAAVGNLIIDKCSD